MKNYSTILRFYSLTLTLAITCALCSAEFPEFAKLQYIGDPELLVSTKSTFFLGFSGKQLLEEFTKLYNQACLSQSKLAQEKKIPKIIHQIWLGSPVPDKYKKWQTSVQLLHPRWQYKLWTDKDINELNLINKAQYEASSNYGERSDIARYEILYRYGGVYVDIDVQFLQPLDYLHDRYDFYACFEPLWSYTYTCLSIGNALIASVPDHPVLAECIEKIAHSPFKLETLNEQIRIVAQTGPILFTRACYQQLETLKKSGIILPSELFYPENPSRVMYNPYRFCIHHWTHSWLE